MRNSIRPTLPLTLLPFPKVFNYLVTCTFSFGTSRALAWASAESSLRSAESAQSASRFQPMQRRGIAFFIPYQYVRIFAKTSLLLTVCPRGVGYFFRLCHCCFQGRVMKWFLCVCYEETSLRFMSCEVLRTFNMASMINVGKVSEFCDMWRFGKYCG